MKHFKKFTMVASTTLILGGLALFALYLCRTPVREISRAESNALIEHQQISAALVTPTVCSGIYSVEGTVRMNDKTQEFRVTARLDESQAKALFEQRNTKVAMPGQGEYGPWINVLLTLLIGGLVVGRIVDQTRKLAEALLERETLTRDEVLELLDLPDLPRHT